MMTPVVRRTDEKQVIHGTLPAFGNRNQVVEVQEGSIGAPSAVCILMPTPPLVSDKDCMPYGLRDSAGITFTVLGTGNADALCCALGFSYRVFFLEKAIG